MKIIGGNFKGRNLVSPQEIRPVALKVRKACFDVLGREVEGREFLDLFAGSGALGFEALSRGVTAGVFVDIKKSCIQAVKKNLSCLNVSSKVEVCLKDAFSAVKDFSEAGRKFGIIFLDPPYYNALLIKALQTLKGYDILTPLGYIVGFCYSKDEYFMENSPFSLIIDKKYGQTRLLIYTKIRDERLGGL